MEVQSPPPYPSPGVPEEGERFQISDFIFQVFWRQSPGPVWGIVVPVSEDLQVVGGTLEGAPV